MNRLEAIRLKERDQRFGLAKTLAMSVLSDAAARGVDVAIIGSLSNGRFGLHSDVDLFVRGSTDPRKRADMERLVAGHFRGSGIPYDVIYESDLTDERAKEFTSEL